MVLRLTPLGNGSAARLLAARGLFEAGRRAEAVAAVEAILRDDPDYYQARYYLGEIFASRGEIWRAMLEFGRVLRTHPRHRETLRRIGDLHFMLDAFDAAADCYRRAIELEPRDVAAWLRLGALAFAIGRDAEAVLAYQHAVELDQRLAAGGHSVGDYHSLLRTLAPVRGGGSDAP